MHEFSLKKRVILPLVLSGMVVFLIGLTLVIQSENRQMDDALRQEATTLHHHLDSILESKTSEMEAMLAFVAQDQALLAAMKSQDRESLLRLSQPLYQRLNQNNQITHLYFHAANRVNLLRVHQPERHGDVIERATLRTAEKARQISSGIELGPLGTFTLRSVLPVFERGQLLGYIELGQEIDELIQQTHNMFGVELYLLIDKQYLSRDKWESGMKMLRRPAHWDLLASSVLTSQSMADIPVDLLTHLAHQEHGQSIWIKREIALAQHQYGGAFIPIQDAGGRQPATLVMLRDMTALHAQWTRDFWLFTGTSSFMGLGILLLFWTILGKTEKELSSTRQKLLTEGLTKAAMQDEFIRQLQAEQLKLSDSEARIKLLLNAVGEGIYGVDLQGNATFVNPAACQKLGYDMAELLHQPMHALVHHSYANGTPYPREKCEIYQALTDGRLHHVTDDLLWQKNGGYFPVEYTSTPIFMNHQLAGAVVVFSDITERKQAQMHIERALHIQRVMDTILNISLPPLTLADVLLLSLDAVLSIPAFALLNKGAVFLAHEDERSLEMVAQRNLPDTLLRTCAKLPFGRCLCGKAAATRELVFMNHLNADHEITYDSIQPHGHYCMPILSEGKLLGVLNMYVPHAHQSDEEERKYLKTVADTMAVVIERKKDEEALRQLAHHDILTGLPNRTLFYDRLEQIIALTQRNQDAFAVLFLDLDHFKEINDSLGHDAGDEVLKEAALRLRACVARKSDTVARMGGDEFTIIFTNLSATEHVESVAKRIIDTLSDPFALNGNAHYLGCSIGIAQYPQDGQDGETLIKHADEAMYRAKKRRNTYCLFSPNPP